LINIEDEIKRLEKEKNALLKDITLYGNKLKNKQYLENAPQHIIDKDRRKLEELTSQFAAFTKAIEKLKTKNF
jgi:valyl-tRNA synthetase